ncbi:ribose 5-phosphate isomerase, putative [Eimeria tenella]|uniref:ribose-5-phosphate isomerase n=1 Tax=Eimeria tenella TaxID=5802 RepID=U6KH11_EIMTE|nr:ribose 5-phosphate isomerase, putative [Eimeria tenella]CDJ37239.1 ribose 5-phosphate isomerase, putative [Eimeria tenella]|eukprot:XP_013228077.1 ribose 5-phosphate isomerase, putative [Eimeria tenella]
MRVGLGTGSTASFAVERLAERIRQGELTDISCASTSEATRKLAESLGINVLSLDEISLPLDVTIDGADEVLKNGSQMVLIKGRGGALLREKIVEVNSKAFICVADEGKVVQPDSFGTTGAVALEVVQFGAQATRQAVLSAVVSTLGGEVLEAEEETPEEAAERLGVSAVFRHHENRKELFVSDNGNLCLDLFFKRPIPDPQKMHDRLINVVGVVETGIFIGISKLCIIGHSSGTTTRLAV